MDGRSVEDREEVNWRWFESTPVLLALVAFVVAGFAFLVWVLLVA